jgi:hypothetical protein
MRAGYQIEERVTSLPLKNNIKQYLYSFFKNCFIELNLLRKSANHLLNKAPCPWKTGLF